MQADPHIQAPKNSQSYNRYSYVLNNPLSYTDPSGYFFSKLWKKIKPFVGVIVAVVASIACAGTCAPALIGALAGGIGAAVNGGNILKGALIGAFSAAAFSAVGSAFDAGTFGNIVGNGVVGGVMSELQGGSFGHGFLAAGFSAAFKPMVNQIGDGAASHSAHRIVSAAVIGGTASKLSGGKFANGAVTGAFSQAFNAESRLKKIAEMKTDVLSRLRKIDEFAKMEADTLKTYGKLEYIFGENIGGSSSLEGLITIDIAQVGSPVPVHTSTLKMENYVDIDAADYWNQVDNFDNMTISLSLERIVVHEIYHGTVGSFNFMVNDHPAVINETNSFMSDHFNELPRDPFSQGI